MLHPPSKSQQKRYQFLQICAWVRVFCYLRARFRARSDTKVAAISAPFDSHPHSCRQGDHYGQRRNLIFRTPIFSHVDFATFSTQGDFPYDQN